MTLRQVGSNMTLLRFHGKEIFFSYETPVAAWVSGRGYIQTDHYYSKTTRKHISMWLEGRSAETVPQAEIDQLCN